MDLPTVAGNQIQKEVPSTSTEIKSNQIEFENKPTNQSTSTSDDLHRNHTGSHPVEANSSELKPTWSGNDAPKDSCPTVTPDKISTQTNKINKDPRGTNNKTKNEFCRLGKTTHLPDEGVNTNPTFAKSKFGRVRVINIGENHSTNPPLGMSDQSDSIQKFPRFSHSNHWKNRQCKQNNGLRQWQH